MVDDEWPTRQLAGALDQALNLIWGQQCGTDAADGSSIGDRGGEIWCRPGAERSLDNRRLDTKQIAEWRAQHSAPPVSGKQPPSTDAREVYQH